MRNLHFLVAFVTLLVPCGFAQKVTVGYDKSADFSKYKSYSLQPPATPSSRPLVYASVVGTIQNDLEAKGLVSVPKDGDLTLIAAGDLGYGLSSTEGLLSDSCKNCQAPLRDPIPWSGPPPPPAGTSGKPVPKGTLELSFVERESNKLVWSGTVVQKLDENKRNESLQKIAAAISKLLTEFPPKKDR
jgi:hypothetical protein